MTAMFSKNSPVAVQNEAETIIGKSVKIEGTFNGQGNIIVEGEVNGNLKTDKNLDVRAGAKITADIEAANMKIAGEINGNVKCHGSLDISGEGKIIGDIETKIISIASGAIIKGKCATDVHETKPKESSKND